MNQLSNLNAKIVKEVTHNPLLTVGVTTTINITVENCHVNAYVEEIIFYLGGADTLFAQNLSVTVLDRGNAYPGLINGFKPITFATISTSNYTGGGTLTSQNIIQNGNTVIVNINQSVQDSEGLGNFYIQLSNPHGFTVPFTMAVVYRPESTYNSALNTRNQISWDKYPRVLSQVGIGTYFVTASTMTDQTNYVVTKNYNGRNNVDIVNFGFTVFSTSPIFYFGTPFPTKRWFLGFNSDCTPNIGVISFAYFDGNNFTGFANSQVYLGAQGPGTYKGAYDGVVIFLPPVSWSPLIMGNDPNTIYNQTMVGLGTLATNRLVQNVPMYWIQCKIGFAAAGAVTISSIVPLIDPELSLKARKRLI
jgi:hypothetical protein